MCGRVWASDSERLADCSLADASSGGGNGRSVTGKLRCEEGAKEQRSKGANSTPDKPGAALFRICRQRGLLWEQKDTAGQQNRCQACKGDLRSLTNTAARMNAKGADVAEAGRARPQKLRRYTALAKLQSWTRKTQHFLLHWDRQERRRTASSSLFRPLHFMAARPTDGHKTSRRPRCERIRAKEAPKQQANFPGCYPVQTEPVCRLPSRRKSNV